MSSRASGGWSSVLEKTQPALPGASASPTGVPGVGAEIRTPERLLTIEQAAAVLNVPRSWLRDKVTVREVPHLRLGRHVRFAPEHLRRIIAASETPTQGSSAPTGARHARRPKEAANDPA